MDEGDDNATLSVGFKIDFHDALGKLKTLDDIIGKTAADTVRQFQRIEAATNGAIDLGGATARITSFGAAATKELESVRRETTRLEQEGERLVKRLERQAQTFGMTAAEIRQMDAAAKAARLEQLDRPELAARLSAAATQMQRLEASTVGMNRAMNGRNGFALQQVALQMPDIVQGLLTGQKPMTVFIQQGGQLAQVAQMAQGGVKEFGKELAVLALKFAPVIAAAGVAAAGFGLFVRWVNEGVTNDQLTRDLGKITGGADATKQELFKLKDATITWGDVSKALFSEVGKDVAEQFVGDMKGMSKGVKSTLDDLTSYGRKALAGLYAGVAGTKAYMGEVSSREGLWKAVTGDPTLLDRTYGAAYRKADDYLTKLGARVKKAALDNARTRLAESIGYNAPKTDAHAAALQRDAEAIEAQIRNLYRLADAYGVSGAEALIAEARVKAESKAIRQRGDIEAAVAREVRLAVAQRVSDAAKATASLSQQAATQRQVTAAMKDGNVPAELAAEMLRDRLADIPLLDALEAARRTKDVTGEAAVTKALEKQRAARLENSDAQRDFALQSALLNGRDRLDELKEEVRLIGATDEARARSLAILRATQQASRADWNGPDAAKWIDQQGEIAAAAVRLTRDQAAYNDQLALTADRWDIIAGNVQNAARGMAEAFGEVGRAIGDMAGVYASYSADRARLDAQHQERLAKVLGNERATQQENAKYALATSTRQVAAYGDMARAARGFFKEGSSGYKAMETAVKVFRAVEFALSVRAMAQDAVLTAKAVINGAVRIAKLAAEGIAAQAKLPFPLNIAAMAATGAALAAIGASVAGALGGDRNTLPKANDGSGTVLGDASAKSESIRRALDALKEVDTLMLGTSREMASSLRSIESQIGGVASLVVRAGNVNADATVAQGFQKNFLGSILGSIPLLGSLLGGLFGSKTEVVGGGLYGRAQSLGGILNGGFDASYYSDIKKTSKFLGITTGTKYSTNYSAADAGLEQQFTLILRGFSDAIRAAAGPLGMATSEVEARVNSFVVDIGKIDLKGLTGAQIEEKLTSVFGAAADQLAGSIFPGLTKFQKVGEGLFETVVRVSSTVETVSASLDKLGLSAKALGIDAKLGIASQFESLSAMSQAADAYFTAFYTPAEQNAAKLAQLGKVFVSLGTTMPATLDGFRALVEAQDLTTAAGQSTYATLLQLAPAFADLKSAMEGAKSAADIIAERQGLERQLLELAGDTAAIRALDLAKLDASNRALQQQVWAVQDAQAAAKAAEDLRKAWSDVGGTIEAEIKRIRGLNGTATGDGSYVSLLGQFNATTAAARAGDQEAAKLLPGLSQSLLKAAGDAATSRQELDRVQAQTAASLEATWAAIQRFGAAAGATSADRMAAAMAVAPGSAGSGTTAANDTATAITALREEVAALRRENAEGHAATASNTGRMARKLDDVTAESGGDAISVRSAA